MAASNIHATALVIGDRGVLITGASGSGKTTLALALVAAAHAAGRFAALIADDRVLLSARGARLVCVAPPAIAGLVEVRGRSPQAIATLPDAVVDLVVALVPQADAPRFAEESEAEIEGCAVPRLTLAERNVNGALAAIQSRLNLSPFV